MTTLTALREELATALQGAGMEATEFVPSLVNPPVAIISPAQPYVQEVFEQKTFDHDYKVTLTVRLVAAREDNEEATSELDSLIEDLLVATYDAWEAEIGQPFRYEVNGSIYLAADATLSASITIA